MTAIGKGGPVYKNRNDDNRKLEEDYTKGGEMILV
jgi:hypothetical protein